MRTFDLLGAENGEKIIKKAGIRACSKGSLIFSSLYITFRRVTKFQRTWIFRASQRVSLR